MRIIEIDQRNLNFEDGLSAIHLRDLKRIVILAGTNGSGKTRLLRRIERMNSHSLGETDARIRLHYPLDDSGKFLNPENNYANIKRHALGVATVPPRSDKPHRKDALIRVVPFVARKLELKDPYELTQKDSLTWAEKAKNPGAAHLADSCLAYIQCCQGRFWEASHPETLISTEEKSLLSEQYADLRDLIKIVLQSDLSRNADGIATLFGRPIPQAGLSDGQRALLQWCVGLHAQGAKIQDMVLTMDEPENHLHPDALNGTVRRIIDANSDGQVWIGTHSVPLIAYLFHRYSDEISLFFMENGQTHYSGRSPEKVLTSLMGGEDNIQALREFIDLPGVFATNRFAAECLLSPGVISNATKDDPQALVVSEAVFANAGDDAQYKILDFGAGRGRMLEGLYAIHGDKLKTQIDYVAWDVSSEPDAHCLTAISKVYGAFEGRWFNDSNGLAASRSAQSFDAAVMCNVLHEIPPAEWSSLFSATAVLRTQLKADGKLVIVEDYLMPKGEYAHPYGFIVLDSISLQKLFQVTSETNQIKLINAAGQRYANRIKAHIVPSSLLANVNGESIKICLDYAISNAEDQIRRLRNVATAQFKTGQAHAFWVQQYANATLARKSFG